MHSQRANLLRLTSFWWLTVIQVILPLPLISVTVVKYEGAAPMLKPLAKLAAINVSGLVFECASPREAIHLLHWRTQRRRCSLFGFSAAAQLHNNWVQYLPPHKRTRLQCMAADHLAGHREAAATLLASGPLLTEDRAWPSKRTLSTLTLHWYCAGVAKRPIQHASQSAQTELAQAGHPFPEGC
jgi:hypothetical protein